MNRKLKKFANKQLKRYQNEDFLNELKAKQKESKMNNKHKKFIPICLSTSSAVIMLAVALLCVFLIKPPVVSDNVRDNQPDNKQEEVIPPKTYSEDNQVSEDSDTEELNGALNSIKFCGDNLSVVKYTDSHYNETLYYSVVYSSDEDPFYVDFKVLTNPDYTIDFGEMVYNQQGTVASYEIQYVENCEQDEDIFSFTDSAVIKTDKETIYINAEIFGFEGSSGFIELLNEIIQTK